MPVKKLSINPIWKKGRPSPWDIACAICKVDSLSGQTYDEERPQSVEERAANLLRGTKEYGPYIVAGDPGRWASCSPSEIAATIYLEPHGTADDCYPPFGYYERSEAAYSAVIPRGLLEYCNAAVAQVFKD